MTAMGEVWRGAGGVDVVYEDDDMLVAVKPVGMSVDASDRGEALDLIEVLRRAGHGGALRVVQHLDRDVSGLVVIARTSEAMRRMVAVDALDATYLAGVEALRVRGGVMQGHATRNGVRLHRVAGARPVACEVVRSSCQEGRTTLVLRSGSGARHVRGLLAAHGAPVAGDVQRGGRRWFRVLLHLAGVAFTHPRTGKRCEAVAPSPWELDAWLAGERYPIDLAQALKMFRQAWASRCALQDTTAYRVFHGEGEGLAGVDLDRFGDWLVLWVDEQIPAALRDVLMDAAWQLGPKGLYRKVRPRAASRVGQAEREVLAPSVPLRGEGAPDELTVTENGLKYWVKLGDGLSTGLFLDQRSNRAWIRSEAKGKAVLNLFAYTCAFSVAAAAGGAASTVSVDISPRALETGRRNLMLGGWGGAEHEMVRDDVVRWVRAARGKPRRFDIIVLDPPSFGSTRRGRFSVEQDYAGLATDAVHLVSDRGGVLLGCTNHRGVTIKRLRGWLTAAVAAAGRQLRGMKEVAPSIDFPVACGGESHMKAVRVWIAPR
jgi:23S rRNA (cytosine1962-C5)-methyltransferase